MWRLHSVLTPTAVVHQNMLCATDDHDWHATDCTLIPLLPFTSMLSLLLLGCIIAVCASCVSAVREYIYTNIKSCLKQARPAHAHSVSTCVTHQVQQLQAGKQYRQWAGRQWAGGCSGHRRWAGGQWAEGFSKFRGYGQGADRQ